MTSWSGAHTVTSTLERLASIAEDRDPRARRKRTAAVLLQLDDEVYEATRAAALELGLMDEPGLRRVEVVRAQALPEPTWRFHAFANLDRPVITTHVVPVPHDGDEYRGKVYRAPEGEE